MTAATSPSWNQPAEPSVAIDRALALDHTSNAAVLVSAGASAMIVQGAFFVTVLQVALFGLSAFGAGVRAYVRAQLTTEVEVLVDKEDPPAPKPEPQTEVVQPKQPVVTQVPKDAPPPKELPAAAPAQAAQVLTANDEGPIDLSNTIVQGSGQTYAGGTTSSLGTSQKAVTNSVVRNDGLENGHGTTPASTPDRTRGAGLLGASDWNCPWPAEAESAGVDEAFVVVQVTVKGDGTAQTVRLVNDPGNGFGREAIRCAMRQRYLSALDHDGNNTAGATKPFRVHFQR